MIERPPDSCLVRRRIVGDIRPGGILDTKGCGLRNLIKLFMRTNAWLYRSTRGRLASQLGRQAVLLLHTIGRKSGKAFVTPLTFYRDGENYLLVATNWGKEEHPDWFLNLMRQSRTRIQVKDATFEVNIRRAEGEEYERMWKAVNVRNPQNQRYQDAIERRIPIVVLSPIEQSGVQVRQDASGRIQNNLRERSA